MAMDEICRKPAQSQTCRSSELRKGKVGREGNSGDSSSTACQMTVLARVFIVCTTSLA